MLPRAAYYNFVGRALQIHGTVQRAGMFMPNLRTKIHMPSLNIPLVIAFFKSHAKEMTAHLQWLVYGL